MRSVKKSTVDELVRIYKKYKKTGDVDLLEKKQSLAFSLSRQAFSNDYTWLEFSNVICGSLGLHKDVPNKTIYEVLKLLGIAVTEE